MLFEKEVTCPVERRGKMYSGSHFDEKNEEKKEVEKRKREKEMRKREK